MSYLGRSFRNRKTPTRWHAEDWYAEQHTVFDLHRCIEQVADLKNVGYEIYYKPLQVLVRVCVCLWHYGGGVFVYPYSTLHNSDHMRSQQTMLRSECLNSMLQPPNFTNFRNKTFAFDLFSNNIQIISSCRCARKFIAIQVSKDQTKRSTYDPFQTWRASNN